MKVTIELIDELRSRVNVSYEEAKRVLEKNDGDLIKSIIELENNKLPNGKPAKAKDGFSEFADKVLQFRLSIKNRLGETLLNIPLVLAVVVVLFAFWVSLLCVVIAVLTSCKIKIYRSAQQNMLDGLKDDVKNSVSKVKKTTDRIFETEKKDKEDANNQEKQYPKYSEYKPNNSDNIKANDEKNDDEIVIE